MALVLNSSSISGLAAVDGLSSPQTGSVLQVVQATPFTSPVTTTSTSFVTTGHSVSITPKFSTSKILLILSTSFGNSSSYNTALTLYRGSSNLATGGATPCLMDGRVNGTSAFWASGASLTFLDSPATTSSTTYTVYYICENGTAYYNTSPGAPSNQVSTLIAMEIAA
jgi:hypothetical protein